MDRRTGPRFFVGLAVCFVARNVWRTVLLWQVLVLTHSTAWLALAVVADALPTLLVGITGPTWGDRGSLGSWLLIEAAIPLAAGLVAEHSAVLLIIGALINGWYGARVVPRSQAEMMRLTPPEGKAAASTRHEFASRVGIGLGPLLAGLLLGVAGNSGALLATAVLFAAASALWQGFGGARSEARSPRPVLGNLREALADVGQDTFLRSALGVRALTNLVSPAFTLSIPLLTLEVWHTHAIGYGLFRSAWGFSTVLATLIVVPRFRGRLHAAFFQSWVVTGIGFILIGLSTGYPLALAMTVLAAIGGPIVHVALDTHIGRSVPSARQGHVFALQRLLTNVPGLLGAGIVSSALARWQPGRVLEGAGLLMVLATAVGFALWRRTDLPLRTPWAER